MFWVQVSLDYDLQLFSSILWVGLFTFLMVSLANTIYANVLFLYIYLILMSITIYIYLILFAEQNSPLLSQTREGNFLTGLN